MILAVDTPSRGARRHRAASRGWQRAARSAPLQAAVAGLLALGVRALGLTSSFELWVDEMLYADLGASVARGEVPRLPDGPFFLHPPGQFILEGAVIRALGLETADSMDLVYDLRWLTAGLGALSVALAYLLVRRVAGQWPAVWAALVLTFEPFVLRNNSRVLLETCAGAAVLAGLLVLVVTMGRRDDGRRTVRLFAAGVLLGCALLTKDVFVFCTAVPVLAAAVWRRTLTRREALPVLCGIPAPYVAYVGFLGLAGYLGDWVRAKQLGLSRLVGADQMTGFNAPGSPSLVDRLLEQMGSYGTSYLLLLICPVAGFLAATSSRPERRLIGLSAVGMGLLGLYLATFGTFEEQFGYGTILTGTLAIAAAAAELTERRPRLRRPAAVLLSAFLLVTAFLGVRLEHADDDGFRTFRAWAAVEFPAGARLGLTNDTSVRAFGGDPRFGEWPTARQLEENGAQYVLTVSQPIRQGYALATPELLDWLEESATPVFRHVGPTNGETVVWFLDEQVLSDGAARGIGGPPPPPLDAGTAGAGAQDGSGP